MKRSAVTMMAVIALGLAAKADLYVDPVNGKDVNSGVAADQAVATIEKARDLIRAQKVNQQMKADFTVWLRGGRYELHETVKFGAEDSGANGFSVVYKNYSNEVPVVCGGRRVTDWKPVPGKPYYQASVPLSAGFTDWFWQLYVNGVRAERARSNTTLKRIGKEWWNDPGTPEKRDGLSVRGARVRAYTNIEDIRCLWVHVFKAGDLPLGVIREGKPGETIFKMQQPAFETWTAWNGAQNPDFFVVNAFEELDEPGEWYLNRKTRTVYYYPCKRDDMSRAEVVAPAIQYLVNVEGRPGQPVHHLRFEGITFQHGQWLDPQHKLLGRSQAEIYMGDTGKYSSELPGQIIFNYADDVTMSGCTVRHMGSCGVQLYEGCHRVTIEGGTFYDLTAAGVSVGRFWMEQAKCPSNTVCTDIMIRDNIVRNTGRDYLQGTGINVFAAQRCKIYHNDVSDIAYTAIHARIGDSGAINPAIGQLEYKYNKVSRGFQGHKWGIGDGGHLYIHGRYPGSEVSENYSLFCNANVNFEYYSDNYSHTVRWTKNVSRFTQTQHPYYAWHPANKGVVFDGNYSDKASRSVGNAKQTNFHLVTNDQWPAEAQRIMDNAGLEPQWRHLANTLYGHENLAQGKRCWASSGADAKNANDGRWGSFWATTPDGSNACWTVDLGAKQVLQRITIMPRQDKYDEHARKDLDVQASNDPDFKEYTVLCERGAVPWYNKPGGKHVTNMWEQYLPAMPGYRYLRVKSTTPGSLSFSDVAAYGYP